jgi:hypothetical protein
LHFGLGAAETAELEVSWPNGTHEIFRAVRANQLLTIKEGTGIIRQERFGA